MPAQPYKAPPAEGDPPSAGRRIGGWAVDAGILFVVGLGIGAWTLSRVHHYAAQDLPIRIVDTIASLLLSGGDVAAASQSLGKTVWADVVSKLQLGILLLIVVEFAYYALALGWKGRTFGRAVVDLQVRRPGTMPPAVPDLDSRPARIWASIKAGSGLGKGTVVRRSLVATVTGTGLYGFAWIMLIHGFFTLSVLIWLISLMVLVGNLIMALASSKRRSLNDRFAGTIVVRTLSHAKAVEAAKVAYDAAHAAGQVAVDGAQRVVQSETFQRVAESEQVQRARQAVRRAAESDQAQRAKQKMNQMMESEQAQRAKEAGQQIAGRFKEAYQKRRDSRTPHPGTPHPGPPHSGPPHSGTSYAATPLPGTPPPGTVLPGSPPTGAAPAGAPPPGAPLQEPLRPPGAPPPPRGAPFPAATPQAAHGPYPGSAPPPPPPGQGAPGPGGGPQQGEGTPPSGGVHQPSGPLSPGHTPPSGIPRQSGAVSPGGVPRQPAPPSPAGASNQEDPQRGASGHSGEAKRPSSPPSDPTDEQPP